MIDGPSDTIYAGFTYTVRLNFPDDYPFKPPKIQFNPSIVHPNVSENGELFISNLCPFGGDCCPLPNAQKWSASWTAETIVVRIIDVLKNPDDVAALSHKQPGLNNGKKKEAITPKCSLDSKMKEKGSAAIGTMQSQLKYERSIREATFGAMNRKPKDERSAREASIGAKGSKPKDERSVREATFGAMDRKLKDERSVREATFGTMDSKPKDERSVREATIGTMDRKLKDERSVREATFGAMNSCSKLKDEGSVEATVGVINSKLKDKQSREEATVGVMNSKQNYDEIVEEITIGIMNLKLQD